MRSLRELGVSLRSPRGLLWFLRLHLLEGCLCLPTLTVHLFAGYFRNGTPSDSMESWAQAWLLLPILVTSTRMPLIVHLLFESSHIVGMDEFQAADAVQVLWGYTVWVCGATSAVLTVWYAVVLAWLFVVRTEVGPEGLPAEARGLSLVFAALFIVNAAFCFSAVLALNQHRYQGRRARLGLSIAGFFTRGGTLTSDAAARRGGGRQLRTFKFGRSGDGSEKLFEPLCTVCLLDFEAEEEVTQLPCKHLFHTMCIDPWLQKRGSCPLGCNRAAPLWEQRVVPASWETATAWEAHASRAQEANASGHAGNNAAAIAAPPLSADRNGSGLARPARVSNNQEALQQEFIPRWATASSGATGSWGTRDGAQRSRRHRRHGDYESSSDSSASERVARMLVQMHNHPEWRDDAQELRSREDAVHQSNQVAGAAAPTTASESSAEGEAVVEGENEDERASARAQEDDSEEKESTSRSSGAASPEPEPQLQAESGARGRDSGAEDLENNPPQRQSMLLRLETSPSQRRSVRLPRLPSLTHVHQQRHATE